MIPRPLTCTGSSNIRCTGLLTRVNVTVYQQFTQAAASAHKRKQSIIIGICTTLALLVLVGLGFTTFFWIRRRQRRKQQKVALSPHPFVELEKTPGQVPCVNSNINPSRITGLSGLVVTSAAHSATAHSRGPTRPILSHSNNHPITHSTVTNTNANAQLNTSGFIAIPATSMRGNRTVEEAGDTNETIVSPVDSAEAEGGVTFQHRDRGRIVYELPPPYHDQVESGHSSPS
jgi:hypothetical protein